MFRVESYITPLITSYLDKYVKLKQEDFQLSLWGGDAVLQKLDLRLDAIERAINIPITFKSGHIHELRLHVPWTKLGSEPVVITINTIECVLKLRDFAYTEEHQAAPKQKIRQKPPNEDLPPGYLQSMLNRIVNNMQIVVNNLILKFVEDDIVMSVNIKSAESYSVDKFWQQAFVDIDPTELILRKMINFNDLTICLDKRDASGKIETYQDPTVYRFGFSCRMYMQYDNLHAKFPNVTKFNLHCEKLDVSLTDSQLPMFFRLLELCIAIYYGELELPEPEVTSSHQDDDSAIGMKAEGESHGQGQQSWAGWAWSFVPQVLPEEEDLAEDREEEGEKSKPPDPILAVAMYCNHITITLKQTEIVQENRYYGPQKIVFKSFTCVELHGVALEVLMQGISFFDARFGIVSSKVYGVGNCPCGISPAQCAPKTSVFFQSGPQEGNKSDRTFCQASLFDPTGPENQGGRFPYLTDRQSHVDHYNESFALTRFPSFWFDYTYTMDGPDDDKPGSSAASSLDVDQMREVSTMTAVLGPCHLALTSTMLHCLAKFLYATRDHDYTPYAKPVIEGADESPHPGATPDQLASLEQFVSSRTYKLSLVSPTLTLVAAEHETCDMATRKVVNTAKRTRKSSRPAADQPHPVVPVPAILVQASRLDAQVTKPMYPRRMVRWISRLDSPSSEFLHICHSHTNFKLYGLQASLYRLDNPKLAAVPFLMPVSAAMYKKTLLLPCFWENRSYPLYEYIYEVSAVQCRLTLPVCLLASHIVFSWLLSNPCPQRLLMTSLVDDVFTRKDSALLECRLSGADVRRCVTRTTSSLSAVINSVQAAITRTAAGKQSSVILLQGPQATPTLFDHAHFSKPRDLVMTPNDQSLVEVTWQLSQSGDDLKVPSVLLCHVSGLVVCGDPALYRWLSYSAQQRHHPLAARLLTNRPHDDTRTSPSPRGSQPTDSNAPTDPPRPQSRLLGTDSQSALTAPPSGDGQNNRLADHVADMVPLVKRTEVQIDMAQSCIIFPTHSQSCRSPTILERVRASLAPPAPYAGTICEGTVAPPAASGGSSEGGYLVCCLPSVQLYSHNHKKIEVIQDLPVQDPQLVNSVEKLPWTLTMKQGSIYTLSAGCTRGRGILKPASLTSTLAITRKFIGRYEDELKSVGLCVHADLGSLSMALSQNQVELLLDLLGQGLNAGQHVMRSANAMRQLALPPPAPPAPAADKRTSQPPSKASTRRDSNSEIAGVSASQPSEPRVAKPALLADAAAPSDSPDAGPDASPDVQLSLWLQVTLPKLLIRLYHHNNGREAICVSTALEDLTSSVDVQEVYCKVKSKIGALNVSHYVQRTGQWRPGDHGGLLLSTSDRLTRNISILAQSWASQPPARAPDYKPRDAAHAFLSLTYTRALARHYSRKLRQSLDAGSEHQYLHEICLTTQPLDLVMALPVILNVKDVFNVHWPKTDIKKDVTDITIMTSSLAQSMTSSKEVKADSVTSELPWLTSAVLPLLYVNLSCCRLFVPLTSRDAGEAGDGSRGESRDGSRGGSREHDVYLCEMSGLVVTPQPDNPLPRAVLEGDEVEKVLEISPLVAKPGTRLEDRQYQIDLTGLGLATGCWRELLSAGPWRDTDLKDEEIIGTQNPALEWNNLLTNSSLCDVQFVPLVAGMDLRVVVAPPVVFSGDQDIKPQVIAGYNAEINAVSDINFTVSTNQIQLLQQISAHHIKMVQSATSKPKPQPIRTQEDILDQSRATTPDVDDFCVIEEETDSQTQVSDGFIVVPHRTEVDRSGVHISTGSRSSVSNVSIATTSVTSSDEMTPVDVLLTAGKISCMLYTNVTSSTTREPEMTSKRKSKSDLEWKEAYPLSLPDLAEPARERTRPVLFCQFTQPHTIVKLSSSRQLVELSCFNFSLKGPKDETAEDCSDCELVDWVETRPGEPDPKTGVPPSLYTLRAQNFLLNAAVISVLLERPVQICVNLSRVRALLEALRTLTPGRNHESAEETRETRDPREDLRPRSGSKSPRETKSPSPASTVVPEERSSAKSVAKLKQYLSYLSLASFSTVQVVVRLEAGGADQQAEVVMDVAAISGDLQHTTDDSGHAEDLVSFLVEDWRLLSSYQNKRRPLVGPLSGSLHASAVWAPHSGSPGAPGPPRVCVDVDVGALEAWFGQEHYLSVRTILQQIMTFLPSSSPRRRYRSASPSKRSRLPLVTSRSEDDLRSGHFTYIFDQEDLPVIPSPYEIQFCDRDSHGHSTMTWTYLEPVCLTRVYITPVPFNVNIDDTSFVIPCWLQYWDASTDQWMTYVSFLLSENESCDLDLPSLEAADKMAAAKTWRIDMETVFDDVTNGCDDVTDPLILPASLAASVRVDSAVLPALVPAVQACARVALVRVRLANHYQHLGRGTCARYQPFFLSDSCHKDQEFLVLNVDTLQLGLRHVHRQQTFISGRVLLQSDITELRQLTVHPLFTPTVLKLHSRLVYNTKQPITVECSVELSPVFVYMRQSYVHTLNTALQAWSQLEQPEKNRVIPAEYVICNDTSVNVKFGQVQTDECVSLECREMIPYNWRSQKKTKEVRVGVEGLEWSWSAPLSLDAPGTITRLISDERGRKVALVVRVKRVSTAVTQVIIRGQLIVASRLDEHLEVKVITHGNETRSSILAARQTMPSYLLPQGDMRALKVKVVGTKGLWTQEIPLSGDKMKEIRMVKIPSGDRSQPVYAWCQIFCDHLMGHEQNLVVLMPVFIVRSHLPTPLLMNVVTPKVNTSRQVKVKGQGHDQQLLTLPGDLVHSVTLQTRFVCEQPRRGHEVETRELLEYLQATTPFALHATCQLYTSRHPRELLPRSVLQLRLVRRSLTRTLANERCKSLTNIHVREIRDGPEDMELDEPDCGNEPQHEDNTTGLVLEPNVPNNEAKASSPPVFLSVGLLDQTSSSATPRKRYDLEALCTDWETDDRRDGSESTVKTRPLPPEVTVVEQDCDHQDINLQIRFDQHWSDCNTLRMDIYPPVLVVNQTPFNVVLSEADRMWTVKKGAAWATQNFTEPVRLGLAVCGRMVFSAPIEFSQEDRSTSVYLPPLEGRLYRNGSTCTTIHYPDQTTGGHKICWFTVQSRCDGGLQRITIRDKFLLLNKTGRQLSLRAVSVPCTEKVHLRDLDLPSVPVPSSAPPCGQPMYLCSLAGHVTDDVIPASKLATYLCLSTPDAPDTGWGGPLTWSQPVRVRSAAEASRQTFAMDNRKRERVLTSSYVLVCQEEAGVTYCTVHTDPSPDTVIHNRTTASLHCGQTRLDLAIRDSGVEEQACPLVAVPVIPANQSAHYTFPYLADKFPQLDTRVIPGMHLAVEIPEVAAETTDTSSETSEPSTEKPTETPAKLEWSSRMEITTDHDCIVNIPNGIDARVHVEKICHTYHIYIDPISRAEMSTREKRDQNVGPETVVVMDTQTKNSEDRNNLLLQAMEDVSMSSSFIMVPPSRSSAPVTSPEVVVTSRLVVHGHSQQVCVILLTDRVTERATEIVRVTVDNGLLAVRPESRTAHARTYRAWLGASCVQVDNQMHESGKYDFRVLFMPQKTQLINEELLDDFLGSVCPQAMEKLFSELFVKADVRVENDLRDGRFAFTTVDVESQPFQAFIEDQFVYDLIELMTSFIPDSDDEIREQGIPKLITCTASSLRGPIRLQHLLIRPISACVSVHASVKMFIGLDNSPMNLGKFEKRDVMTTVSHVTRVATMHYVSAAIFRAGWVVGSLELLGNPAGLVRNVGSGVLDLFRLPIQGITRGPASFLAGIVGGVSSLVWHVSTGTLSSVTNLASSVSRNMDRLSLDEDHWQRQEAGRRQALDGVGQGLRHGLTGFGISLLGAVAGLADQPLQSLQHGDRPSPGVAQTTLGFLSGLGKGLIGVVTKPVGGAAELVSQTGKGLLQTAGLTSHHQGRYEPFTVRMERAKNAHVKFLWKLLPELGSSDVLYVADCKQVVHGQASLADYHLVLTTTALFLVKVEEDCAVQALLLSQIECQSPANHPTVLLVYLYSHTRADAKTSMSLEEKSDRIAEYLSTSSTDAPGVTSYPDVMTSYTDDDDVTPVEESVPLTQSQSRYEFHTSPRQVACFIRYFKLAQRISGQGFPVT